ncbi:MAG: hypothetical protein ABSC94_07225 [Polyangiaceae bacterium]|jgi:hypothetical protein
MSRIRSGRWVGVLLLVALGPGREQPARAEADGRQGVEVVLDRTIVRFFAPETGGSAHPRFVTERMLAFEARLEAMNDKPDGIGGDYDDRRLRAALDHHIGEEMLASLALKLIYGAPAGLRPSEESLALVRGELAVSLFERLGGEPRVEAAAAAEQIGRSEVDDLLRRQGLAAWYIDRAVAPILNPTEEQLREVFRTAAHPYRGQPFEESRRALSRWVIGERLRVAETSFLQAARARLSVIVTE